MSEPTEYTVEWRIELSATSPEDAARKALTIQRDPRSLATVFHVATADGATTVDLTALAEARTPAPPAPERVTVTITIEADTFAAADDAAAHLEFVTMPQLHERFPITSTTLSVTYGNATEA